MLFDEALESLKAPLLNETRLLISHTQLNIPDIIRAYKNVCVITNAIALSTSYQIVNLRFVASRNDAELVVH